MVILLSIMDAALTLSDPMGNVLTDDESTTKILAVGGKDRGSYEGSHWVPMMKLVRCPAPFSPLSNADVLDLHQPNSHCALVPDFPIKTDGMTGQTITTEQGGWRALFCGGVISANIYGGI